MEPLKTLASPPHITLHQLCVHQATSAIMALFPEIVLKGILKKIRQFGVIYIVLSLDVLFILEKMFSKGRSIQMNAWMSRLQSPAVRSRRLLQVKVSSRT